MTFRFHIPPADFELARCSSCGNILDFTFVLRLCIVNPLTSIDDLGIIVDSLA